MFPFDALFKSFPLIDAVMMMADQFNYRREGLKDGVLIWLTDRR